MKLLEFPKRKKAGMIGHLDNGKTALTAAMTEILMRSNDDHVALLAEYRAGRMSRVELERHMEADHGFRSYVREFERNHAQAWRL